MDQEDPVEYESEYLRPATLTVQDVITRVMISAFRTSGGSGLVSLAELERFVEGAKAEMRATGCTEERFTEWFTGCNAYLMKGTVYIDIRGRAPRDF